MREASPQVRQRYDNFRIRQGDISGVLPQRECRLYANKSPNGAALLIARRQCPGLAWYVIGLTITVLPLLALSVVLLIRGRRRR